MYIGTGLFACTTTFAQKQLPNIIYIFTDQQTATAMSCAGNTDVNTPNMDRLAREGIRFTNAYCAAPLSTPSRAAMLTGVPPGASGMLQNGSKLKSPYSESTIGTLLNEKGYDCGYAGKWHLPESDIPDERFGFRKVYEHNDYGLAEACVKFLSEKRDKPFFLIASFDNPHNICEYARSQNLPFAIVEEPHIADCPNLPANFAVAPFDADVIRIEQAANPKLYPTTKFLPDDWRRYRNAYYRLVETVDREIGKIINALDKQKLWDNTIVIFSSDHGDGNAAHQWNQKSALYEETTNIPFIVRLPKQKTRGIVKEQLVNNGTDLFVTICDYAEVVPPAYCLGKSLKNVLEEKNQDFNESVVAETLFDEGTTKGWMVRTKDYKYIVYDKGRYREQLYDMRTDRGETVNLAIEKKYKTILDEHRRLLNQWHEKNNVPKDRRATPTVKTLSND